MWREQAIIEWSRRVISIVACCNSVKLYALPARAFRSQQNGAVTRMWRSCCVKPSQKERAIGAVRCKKEGMLLQPLRWQCVECVIHHERDVREEQQYIYVARTSNNRVIAAITPLALCWMRGSPRTECGRRTTPIYMWREQATIEWSRRVISIVACCNSVKLYALPARAFRSQHHHSQLHFDGQHCASRIQTFWYHHVHTVPFSLIVKMKGSVSYFKMGISVVFSKPFFLVEVVVVVVTTEKKRITKNKHNRNENWP